MIFIFLITAFVISLLIAGRFPRTDRILALTITITLIVMCSTFKEGYDYESYLNMITEVRGVKDADYIIKLKTAIDPLFWGVVTLAELIDDDPLWVFAILASIALLPKFLFTVRFPAYRSLIISSYGLFLAPTLEFAAIRAAAALGVLVLTLSFGGLVKRLFGYVMAVASHASAIIPVLVLLLKRVINRFPTGIIAGGVVLLTIFLSGIVSKLSRVQQYIENKGTLFALSLPLATVLLIIIGFSGWRTWRTLRSTALLEESFQIALVCSCIALGGCLYWVTVAYRFLELGQSFFCVAACIALKAGYSRKRLIFMLLGIVALLVYKNITLGTWKILM